MKLIISDPGIDDAIALFVSAAIPENLAFIATYGNATTTITSANLNGITDFIHKNLKPNFKKSIPAYTGTDRPLKSKKPYEANLDFIHGEKVCEGQFNNYKPLKNPSTVLYKKIIRENKKIDVISVGAITELAIILQTVEMLKHINSITFMGGALFVQGNRDTHVEANLYDDPQALDIVLRLCAKKGIPLTIVPLDVTENPDLELTTKRITNICNKLNKKSSENIADMLMKLAGPKSTYPNFYRSKRGVISHIPPITKRLFKGSPIHDLTAKLVKTHPQIFTMIKIPIIQRYPGVLGVPTSWMNPPKYEHTVVMDIKDPEKYWDITVEYLSKYK